jgi:hypothetical protein
MIIPVGISWERGNKPSFCTKRWEFIEQISLPLRKTSLHEADF